MAHPTAPSAQAGEASSTLVESIPYGTTSAHIGLLTPGKVAIWLFLATEIMFFTGLIGAYIVFRAGSSANSYSNLHPPATPYAEIKGTSGVLIKSVGQGDGHARALKLVQDATGWKPERAEAALHETPHAIVGDLSKDGAE